MCIYAFVKTVLNQFGTEGSIIMTLQLYGTSQQRRKALGTFKLSIQSLESADNECMKLSKEGARSSLHVKCLTNVSLSRHILDAHPLSRN